MFLDEVVIDVASGNGGRGAVSFRREKYVPQGGPDGGDGGRGGDVVVRVDPEVNTLSHFGTRRRYAAKHGTPGGGQLRSGAGGAEVALRVPAGTVVADAETGEVLADLDQPGGRVVVCSGGRGGRGNARFATATRQAPRVGELGAQGEQRRLRLELKLIADVGLVGFPNAGKSTLLATLTGAHPKIAAYPFTTLSPNLGVAEVDGGQTVILADVPGLIEGAHRGVGLGHDFLRHLERTRVLVHVVDCSAGAAAAFASLTQIEDELRRFSDDLAAKPRVVALNKMDLPEGAEAGAELAKLLPGAHLIAAIAGTGCEELMGSVLTALRGAGGWPRATANEPAGLPTLVVDDDSDLVDPDAPLLDPGGFGDPDTAPQLFAPLPAAVVPGLEDAPYEYKDVESLRRRVPTAAGGGAVGVSEGDGSHRVYRFFPKRAEPPIVTREDDAFRVHSPAVERMVSMTDLDSEESVHRLQRRMREAGVDAALAAAGCHEGDTVLIGKAEFDWEEG